MGNCCGKPENYYNADVIDVNNTDYFIYYLD